MKIGKHTMVIADSSSAHEECPKQTKAGYNLVTGGLDEGDVVNSWSLNQELRSGKYALTDYNFTTPSTSLLVTEPTIVSVGGNSNFEIFDYPGEYPTRADGTSFAKLRMQEEEAGHLVANGSSGCRAFTTGYKFALTDHYQTSMNTSYVLTEIQHIASVAESYGTTGGSGGTYSNHFACIPESVPFRPQRLTPKPFVQGPQTAVVIGKAQYSDNSGDDGSGDGEEIWVDSMAGSSSAFPGIVTVNAPAASVSRRIGRARAGALSPSHALARRFSSASSKAIRTARSSLAESITQMRRCPSSAC